MRNNDPRSRCIAILPDLLVNAHLLEKGDGRRAPLEQALAILEQAGFGFHQLPPDDLPVDRARASIDFALDQIADYLKHGYRFLRIDLGGVTGPPAWQPYLERELDRRALAGIETWRLTLDPAGLRGLAGRAAAIRQSAQAASPL
ncbi:MAG TPA: hypothetical protein VHA10_00430 [Hypericibacter adhaerens]|jgi:hypothetical protein|uniref:Uncharacterized protein n=1 Tax=Hypericibacter adhaerens TaxID=2602016 RepID=A0A5J6N275_9PROT|nr:hypothetical protein [Hypericibacter adhaerens]QEX23617.1 hypothetical protein FRZ61_35550 [Hypericibacter adhaerens]HWA41647.1 hypothetical protein [Hypericibacter adhaerens]